MGLAVHMIFPFIPEERCVYMCSVIAGVTMSLLKFTDRNGHNNPSSIRHPLGPVVAVAVVTGFS